MVDESAGRAGLEALTTSLSAAHARLEEQQRVIGEQEKRIAHLEEVILRRHKV